MKIGRINQSDIGYFHSGKFNLVLYPMQLLNALLYERSYFMKDINLHIYIFINIFKNLTAKRTKKKAKIDDVQFTDVKEEVSISEVFFFFFGILVICE